MNFQEFVPLAHFSSYKIGGPARYFFEPKTERELVDGVRMWREDASRYDGFFILGGGTNLLISDEGWKGIVVKPSLKTLEERSDDKVFVEAGVLMKELISFTLEKSLSGLEWAGGLPGTVGGAIRGNAGCFGGETKDAIVSVRALSLDDLKIREFSRDECDFAYRSSF